MGTILFADDDRNLRYSFRRLMEARGHTVHEAADGPSAIAAVVDLAPNVLVMDIRMPGGDGLTALREVKRVAPKLPVIIITGFGTMTTAIEAMKFGAFDYLLKPFDVEDMVALVGRALEADRLMRAPVALDAAQDRTGPAAGDAIIGRSAAIQAVLKLIGEAAASDAPVLIRGETGTGKELVARAIYQYGTRAGCPFLAINCAAIPETLLESELFGYEKGAFTGAAGRRLGKFEQANGGTTFLDEIGDMTPLIQAKVLRLLQDGSFERLGGFETLHADVRLLAATNQPIEQLVAARKFREDLFYRLAVLRIDLPPLREHRDDLPDLVRYFLPRVRAAPGRRIVGVAEGAMQKLLAHDWPGNVRELENTLKRAAVLARGDLILPDDVQFEGTALAQPPAAGVNGGLEHAAGALVDEAIRRGDAGPLLPTVEAILIRETLVRVAGNLTRTAQLLGVDRHTLRNRMRRYGISVSTRVSADEEGEASR